MVPAELGTTDPITVISFLCLLIFHAKQKGRVCITTCYLPSCPYRMTSYYLQYFCIYAVTNQATKIKPINENKKHKT